VRGGLKLNFTLGFHPATSSQSLGGHRRKKLLAFLICARGILFEKGKGVFSSVFYLQVFGRWRAGKFL